MNRIASVIAASLLAVTVQAQGMDHSKMAMGAAKPASGASVPSQAAFATIQDIVKTLKADPATDWSRVNLEALRQHLIDMDDVVMRSSVKQSNVDGGVALEVTGEGKVAAAIRRMGAMHAEALTGEGVYAASSSEIANGVRLVITAKNPVDTKVIAMIRGLGFAGLMTEGDHHAAHHMMMATGGSMAAGHQHKP